MKIGVYKPSNLPVSLSRYVDSILTHLSKRGIAFAFYGDADLDEIDGQVDLLWDPCCGWPMGPVWPTRARTTPRVVTFHGAAAFSMSPIEFWGASESAIKSEVDVLSRLGHWLDKAYMVDAAIVPSEFASRELNTCVGIPVDAIQVIYHGVDLSIFNPEDHVSVHESQGYILHVSSWQPKKNLEAVISAYRLLDEKSRPDLVIVAPGYPNTDSAIVPGVHWVTDMQSPESLAGWYRRALVFLFPSLHETFGLPVLEAMACGCPVVTSNDTALEECFGDAALLADPRNPEEIAQRLRDIVSDADLRNALRNQGIELAKRLTWDACADRHADIFSDLVKRQKRSDLVHGKGSTCILVLGMHRSGTSLIAGTLGRIGVSFGEHLLPPQADNPRGFYEDRDVVSINNAILRCMDRRWDDVRPLPEDWTHHPKMREYTEKIRDLLIDRFAHLPLWGMKDPRLSRLLPLWMPVMVELGIRVHVVSVMRDPVSVSASLLRRNEIPPSHASLLWLRYQLELEMHTRSLPRYWIEYSNFMRNWPEMLPIMAESLGVTWEYPLHRVAAEIDEFVDEGLRHHASRDVCSGNDLSDTLWRTMSSASDEAIQRASDAIAQRLKERDKEADAYIAMLDQRMAELESVHKRLGETLQHQATLDNEINLLRAEGKTLQEKLAQFEVDFLRQQELWRTAMVNLYQSRSWRLTKPLRELAEYGRGVWGGRDTAHGQPNWYPMARRVYRAFPLPMTVKQRLKSKVARFLPVVESNRRDYQSWVDLYDQVGDSELVSIKQHIKSLVRKPVISIAMPTHNTDIRWLEKAIESVRAQWYENWELCIADDASTDQRVRTLLEQYASKDTRIKVALRNERGHISATTNDALGLANSDYVGFLDHDDELAPSALYWMAVELNKCPDATLIYSDEDKIDDMGRRFDPYFKPDFSYDLFLGQNLITHFAVYKRSLLESLGGLRIGVEGAQDWDLALRAIEVVGVDNIRHIPRVLYHWRVIEGSTALSNDEKPYAYMAQRRVLEEHVSRLQLPVRIQDHPKMPGIFHRARWALPDEPPLVTVIIPTYNHADTLSVCVDSLESITSYPNYEVIVVDNRSDENDALDLLDEISSRSRFNVLRYPHPFNYSAINNFAVKRAKGEVIVLLNNDTEVISPEWLHELTSHALRPGIGAVGARLLYPDGTVQHGGVIMGLGGYAAHSHRGFPQDHPGQSGRLWLTQNYSAVTGACLAIRRQTYEQVGGLNEQDFSVAYNDIDLCLRLAKQGFRNIYTPFAELYHYESKSRGEDDHDRDKHARFNLEKDALRRAHADVIDYDPYYNPNLTLDAENFSLAFPPRVSYYSDDKDAS